MGRSKGRRARPDPLATSSTPRYLTVLTMMGAHAQPWRELAPGTDLHAAMDAELQRWRADGWTVEEDGRWGFCFVNRNGERLQVSVHAHDPSTPFQSFSAFQDTVTKAG